MALLQAITCVLITQMGHASSFQTFNFQELSNNIRNISIQWVLTSAIGLQRFRNPLRVQLPKWELTWEGGGSFLHTLPHSQEHECDFQASLLACTFASPCLGHEPKIKVTALEHLSNTFIILIMKYSHNNLKEKM